MKHIVSKVTDNLLLHLVNRKDDIIDRTNVAPDDEFLQLATLRMEKGKTFKPHKHIWKSGSDVVIGQESWIVVQGSVKVFFYDVDDTLLSTEILNPGDCSMTFKGGHTYEILEDDTIVYEYKTGPYTGIDNDKVFI